MKIIETKGITYLEKFETTEEWYFGTDYSCGDLYEAEDVFRMGERFTPNRLVFVHYPDGQVCEPIKAQEGQYFGMPTYIEGAIYILLADFNRQMLQIYQSKDVRHELSLLVELSLSEVEDCYNLCIVGDPAMLIRQDEKNRFQIVWPERIEFLMEEHESFLFREGDKLYFSEWHEDEATDEYYDEVKVREYPTGHLLEKTKGAITTMPDGQKWMIR